MLPREMFSVEAISNCQGTRETEKILQCSITFLF